MRKNVERMWLSFEAAVIPATAGRIQRSAMRDAFFAGAIALFYTSVEVSHSFSEADAEDFMSRIEQEFSEFIRTMNLKAAMRTEQRT